MFSEKWHYRFMEVAKLVATWSKDRQPKPAPLWSVPTAKSVPPVITVWSEA